MNKKKTLIVIPAYNEEKNIKNVIDDLMKDINFVDIVVINDGSEDNTKKIVEENGIKCIDGIFNMGYSCTVQTGIKYAYQNNYDFVIQFDADGQHIAKEAIKLLKIAQEENIDIVIGSRYLKDLGYSGPLFRKLGTKIFSCLIKYFCNEEIKDPLSGFQCLNKKVIERYSKMGAYPEYPDANLIIEMLMNGFSIKEVPVKMRLRKEGQSMHSGIIKPIKYMINMFYTIIFIILQNIGTRR